MKKYEFTGDTLEFEGRVLKRIIALRDFQLKELREATIRKGCLGGWIESEKNLSQEGSCWVDDEAKVYGNTYQKETSVTGDAWIFGEAIVGDNCVIQNNATIYGNAKITNSKVMSNISVYGNAWIENSTIFSSGQGHIYGNAVVDSCQIAGRSFTICENAYLKGLCMDFSRNILSDPLVDSKEFEKIAQYW